MRSESITAKKQAFLKLAGGIFSFALFASIVPLAGFQEYQRMVSFEQTVFGTWLIIIGFGLFFELAQTHNAVKKDKTATHVGVLLIGIGAVLALGFGAGIFAGVYSPLGGTSDQGNALLAVVLMLGVILFVSFAWSEIVHHNRFIEALAKL